MIRKLSCMAVFAAVLWVWCVFMGLSQDAINLVFLMWFCMIVLGPRST